MLSGEKVLITGPGGRIAHGIAKTLAPDNEVWGIARFSDPTVREEVEALSVTTRVVDLADPDFGVHPRRFHLSASYRRRFRRGLRTGTAGQCRGHGTAAVALP